jgi:hypothetical protein
MARALPGKRPLLVPASLRNPQHFHRLCTGLAPLRTSHPHVCAQAAGSSPLVGWQAAADRHGAPVLVCPGQRAACEDPGLAGPIAGPCRVGTDVRRCRVHVTRRQESGCALVGIDMIKVPANRKPLPAADGCRILCNLSAAAGILVSAGAEPQYLCYAGRQPILGFWS